MIIDTNKKMSVRCLLCTASCVMYFRLEKRFVLND